MLLVAAAYSGRRARKRLYAASSYLKESRYKDYETALYTYASDGTEECRKVMEEIIEMELRKRRGCRKTDDRQAARCFYALRQGEREEL